MLDEWANPNMPQELPGESLEQGLSQQYSPEEVGYRPADSAKNSCSRCTNFTPKAQQSLGAGVCSVVAGPIQPNGVCDAFQSAGGLGALLEG